MSLKKRIAAGICALAVAASLAGCGSDTAYVLKADGKEIAAGVYIDLMLTEYSNQVYSMYYSGTEVNGSYFDQKVDDKPMDQYLQDYAYDTCLKIAAVEKRCDELGVKLSEDEEEEIDESVKSAWDSQGDYYHEMGVSQESIRRIYRYSYLSDKLFEAYYYEGGIEEVKLSDATNYVNENFLRYKQIMITKGTDDSGAAAKTTADKYMEYADEMDMDALIEKYKEEQSSSSESSDDSDDSDSSSDTDSSEIDSSSEANSSATDSSEVDSSSDTDSSATDSSEVDSSGDTDSSEIDSSSEADSSVSDSSAEDSSDGESDEEKTPSEIESEKYPNEYLRNKASYEDDDFVNFVDKMELNKITLYEDDTAYYILEKLDMKERSGYTEANLESIISIMKDEDFETLLDGLAGALSVEKNQKALDRYNAKDVYERQLKWSEKHSD